jgi:hypothetical protein
MNIEVTTTEHLRLHVSAGPMKPAQPLDECNDATKHAALRAIAEHLGPEAVWEVLGTSSETDADLSAVLDELSKLDGYRIGSARSRVSFLVKDVLDARQAIRAAGYDPDEVEAAEVIGLVCAQRDGYTAACKQLGKEMRDARNGLDTARAQLRELAAPAEELLRSCRQWRNAIGKPSESYERGALIGTLATEGPKLDRLLSATPDEGDAEPMVPAGERGETVALIDGKPATANDVLEEWRESCEDNDRLRKRVEELEADNERTRSRLQDVIDENYCPTPEASSDSLLDILERMIPEWCAAAEKLSRAEAAMEAMRPIAEEAIRQGFADGTIVLSYRRQKVAAALADYYGKARLHKATDDGTMSAEAWAYLRGQQDMRDRAVRACHEHRAEAHDENGVDSALEELASKLGDMEERELDEGAASGGPEPARVVGGGKLEPLVLRCADTPTRDWLRFYSISINCICACVRERDQQTSVNLSRASVRRLRDWLTDWLGDCNASGRAADPDADTPEAIARDACEGIPYDEGDKSVIAARIRRYGERFAAGELRAVVEQARKRERAASDCGDTDISIGVWEVADMAGRRADELEKGGGK